MCKCVHSCCFYAYVSIYSYHIFTCMLLSLQAQWLMHRLESPLNCHGTGDLFRPFHSGLSLHLPHEDQQKKKKKDFPLCLSSNFKEISFSPPLDGAISIHSRLLWARGSNAACGCCCQLLLQTDHRRENKGRNMIRQYKSPLLWLSFSPPHTHTHAQHWPPAPTGISMCLISAGSLHWFSRLTYTPGVKMHLIKSPQNTLKLASCAASTKPSTDCCTHLLSFGIYASTAADKRLSSTMRGPHARHSANYKHRCKYTHIHVVLSHSLSRMASARWVRECIL